MVTEKQGGRAFPLAGFQGPQGWMRSRDGMSLRDYFAGQALAGLCADASVTENMATDAISALCYRLADAMLAEREKSQ